jgi:hypothetical protein
MPQGQSEVIDAPIVRRDTGLVMESITRGELEMQVELAKKYPRDVKKFREEATALATLDERTADQCIYALPGRKKKGGGKTAAIEGPSARFAEVVASTWGNCSAGARVIAEDDNFVTSQGVFRDLERNVSISFEARRRITTKEGRRYSDDMIAVTANAACSIALRNAVLKGVPKAFWQPIYDEARKASVGDAQTMLAKRQAMFDHFGKMGVDEERVLASVDLPNVDAIGLEELAILKGIATAVKDGEISVDAAFPPVTMENGDQAQSKAESVLKKIRKGKGKGQASRPTPGKAGDTAEGTGEATQPKEPRSDAPERPHTPPDAAPGSPSTEDPVPWGSPEQESGDRSLEAKEPGDTAPSEATGKFFVPFDQIMSMPAKVKFNTTAPSEATGKFVPFDQIMSMPAKVKFNTTAKVLSWQRKQPKKKVLTEVIFYVGPHQAQVTHWGEPPDWLEKDAFVRILEIVRSGEYTKDGVATPTFTVGSWELAI